MLPFSLRDVLRALGSMLAALWRRLMDKPWNPENRS